METFTKEKYGEKVAALLRQRIRAGKLRPGDVVREEHLAVECGISRAPVREALHLLENEGLLMSHPRRGKIVTVLTPEDIMNSYQISGLLEGEAASSVVARGLPAEVAAEFDAAMELMQAALENEANGQGLSYEEFAELGSRFHRAVLSLSDNVKLRALATRSSRIISKFLLYQEWRTIYSKEELYDRHLQLHKAILTADELCIRRAFREHYAEAAGRLAQFCRPADDGEQEAFKKKKRQAHIPSE